MSADTSRVTVAPIRSPGGGDLSYMDGGGLLVAADGPAAFTRAGAAAAAAGVPVLASVVIADASSELERRPHWVMIELDAPPQDDASAAALDRLLGRVATDTAAGRYSAVISTPPEMIDLVAGRADNARIAQLADASQAERVSALLETQRIAPSRMREHGADGAEATRIRALTDEVLRIAGALAQLTGSGSSGAPRTAEPAFERGAAADVDQADLAELARLRRRRAMRGRYFDAALFADPAWDMLLDLAAARIAGKPVAVSSLCIAAAVPATTALRWIRMLTDAGLFVRRADPADGRRVFIDLAQGAAAAMRGYLREVRGRA